MAYDFLMIRYALIIFDY